MKTKQEIEKMRDDIQAKIDKAHKMYTMGYKSSDSEYWYVRKNQLIAQYNILLEVLK